MPCLLKIVVQCNTLAEKIVWFHTAPVLQGSLKLLGTKGYYNHRPAATSVSIHLHRENLNLKALFLFSNTKPLIGFSDRLGGDHDQVPITQGVEVLPRMFQQLVSQIIQDGVGFLKGVSEGIHFAVNPFSKFPNALAKCICIELPF